VKRQSSSTGLQRAYGRLRRRGFRARIVIWQAPRRTGAWFSPIEIDGRGAGSAGLSTIAIGGRFSRCSDVIGLSGGKR